MSKLNVWSVPTFSISFLPSSSYAGVEEDENGNGKLLRKIKQFSILLVLFNNAYNGTKILLGRVVPSWVKITQG